MKSAVVKRSSVIKRSIVVAGHKTSVSLEDAFWKGLKEIAGRRESTLSDIVAAIDGERSYGNLSSAIRLYVLDHYRGQCGDGASVQKMPVMRTESAASTTPTHPSPTHR
jgi:predicted DNA-binding ribbon-helix-helix protein